MEPERGGMCRGAGDVCFAMKDQNARCGTAEGKKARRVAWTGQGRVGQRGQGTPTLANSGCENAEVRAIYEDRRSAFLPLSGLSPRSDWEWQPGG